MEHYEHCDFDDENHESTRIVAKQLSDLDFLDKRQPVTLPGQALFNFDLREYLVEVVSLWLQRAYNAPHSPAIDGIVMHLLETINNKSYIWANHGSQLVLPILRILSRTKHIDLQVLCLRSCICHLELKPSLSDVRMLFSFDIPYKLVKITKNMPKLRADLRDNTLIAFRLIAERMKNDKATQHSMRTAIEKASLEFLQRILQEDLLRPFIPYTFSPEAAAVTSDFWGEITLAAVQKPTLAEAKLDETYRYLKSLSKRSSQTPSTYEDVLIRLFNTINNDTRKQHYSAQCIQRNWRTFHARRMKKSSGSGGHVQQVTV